MEAMALSTAFTESLSIRHPIALAPMGGSAGGALAAAVSNGGGLGLVGARREDPDWTDRELAKVAEGDRVPSVGDRRRHARTGARPSPAGRHAVFW